MIVFLKQPLGGKESYIIVKGADIIYNSFTSIFFVVLAIIIQITIRKLEPRISKSTMLKVRIAITTTVLLIGVVLYIIDPQRWILIAFVVFFCIVLVMLFVNFFKRRSKSH